MKSCYNERIYFDVETVISYFRKADKAEIEARTRAYKARGTERKSRTNSGHTSVNVNRKG